MADNIKIYLVGGAVRDQLMGMQSKDLDYAVECPSYAAMLDYIVSHGGTVWQERPEYQTVRAKMPGLGDADFVLCRKDGFYSDGRHPDSVQPGTIFDDLARRDFTINAIAYDTQTKTYLDPHDGRKDLSYRILRCVGDPYIRFNEDALRMLRALRFAVTKQLVIHHSVDNELRDPQMVAKLKSVPDDRVRDELTRAFRADSWEMLKLLMERYRDIAHLIFTRSDIWLKPTMEDA